MLEQREFTAEDFARSHPGGSLGRRLLVRVKDVMRTGDRVPRIGVEATIQDAIEEITGKGMGFTAVVDAQHKPLGMFTDGDLRRLFVQGNSDQNTSIQSVMNTQPRLLHTQQMAVDAVMLMEQYKINGFLAINDAQQLVGAFNMHDLLKAKVV